MTLHARVKALERSVRSTTAGSGGGGGGADTDAGAGAAVVTVMATGRAVEKALRVAGWFEQEGDCAVAVRTGTVGTVDDVVVEDGEGEDESRIRKMSCLEVQVRLR